MNHRAKDLTAIKATESHTEESHKAWIKSFDMMLRDAKKCGDELRIDRLLLIHGIVNKRNEAAR